MTYSLLLKMQAVQSSKILVDFNALLDDVAAQKIVLFIVSIVRSPNLTELCRIILSPFGTFQWLH